MPQHQPDGVSVDYVERTISLDPRPRLLGVVLAVLIVVTALIFRRRDVT